MLRTIAALFTLSCGFALASVSTLHAQQPPIMPPPKIVPEIPAYSVFSKTPDIIQRLQTQIVTTDLQEKMALSSMLKEIQDQLVAKKKDVTFLIDEAAFRAELPPLKEKLSLLKSEPPAPEPPVATAKVVFPALPAKMTVATALRVLLGQLPRTQATYLIRQGTVVITTQKRAGIKSLLQERVSASFNKAHLFEAFYALSDQTGASIVLDPKVTEFAWAPVSATFANDATLDSALTMLTDMVGLRAVTVGDGIYVTTPENADRLRYLPKY